MPLDAGLELNMASMAECFDAMLSGIDAGRLLRDTEALWRAEFGQTHACLRRAARVAAGRMRRAGLDRVERIPFPADGKTVFGDATQPLAWSVSDATLTVLSARHSLPDPIVASYRRHPFHAIKGSPGTPPEGVRTRMISEEQMFGGEDARGAMVLLSPETKPTGQAYRAACDFGAIGVVSGWSSDPHGAPDGITWVNAFTDGQHWHSLADDRPLIGFSVSPRTAGELHAAIRAGNVTVQVRSDARRFASTADVVTGVIPGRSTREVWLLAHLYEPMPDDNATGVAAGIEIARVIRALVKAGRLPRPAFTLRLLFGWERYGFAAYAHRRGRLRGRVLGAINLDALPLRADPVTAYLAPPAAPFYGDALLEALVAARGTAAGASVRIDESGGYGDDLFLNDPTLGVPTVWIRGERSLWHHSEQTLDRIDPVSFVRTTAWNGAWCARMLTLDRADAAGHLREAGDAAVRRLAAEAQSAGARGADPRDALQRRLAREESRLLDFARVLPGPLPERERRRVRAAARRLRATCPAAETPDAPAADAETNAAARAAALVPIRLGTGLPQDLRRAPHAERLPRADVSPYGPYARILAGADGKRNLLELARQAAWETGSLLTDVFLERALGALSFLSEHGYVRLRCARKVARRDVAAALRRAGIRRGDLVFLHAGLSRLGHVAGGPDAVIDGVLDVIGPRGTLLVPVFARSFTYFNGSLVRGKGYRPHRPGTGPVFTGRIASVFSRRPGILRSAHASHAVAGIGPLARELLADHAESDPPACRHSPVGKLPDYNGRIVWLGADVTSTTLLHVLEDELRLPYLQDALCHVERADGRIDSVFCPRHLSGHRDFYRPPGERGKMFQRLLADGLEIRRTPLGFGSVRAAGARELFTLGLDALRREPGLLLCDDSGCAFCARAHALLRSRR